MIILDKLQFHFDNIMFKVKKLFNKTKRGIPFIISVVCLFFVFDSLSRILTTTCDAKAIFKAIHTDIITISGIIAGIIIAYLTSKVLQIRNEKIARIPELKDLTQKVHKFRSIVNELTRLGVPKSYQ
jgi:hypothetical protein